MKKKIGSLQECQKLAVSFAKTLAEGDVVVLSGDLGAGKTTFTQFVLRSLGVKEVVNSPTFSILKSYNGKFRFEHIDAYRINTDEALNIGLDELLSKKDRVFFIEWAENIAPLIPKKRISVRITHLGETEREFEIIHE